MNYNFNNVENAYGINNVELKRIYGSNNYLLWEKQGLSYEDYLNMYLTIKFLDLSDITEENRRLYFDRYDGSNTVSRVLEYNINNTGWVEIHTQKSTTYITVNTGDVIQIRSDEISWYGTRIWSPAPHNIYGNIMSLIDSTNYASNNTLLYEDIFRELFSGSNMVNTNNLILPATTLSKHCYFNMFSMCRSLTSAPALPATTLAYGCYTNMFSGCWSLTSAPALPATTLTKYCYDNMFYNCSSLTSPPVLPATTLAEGCYNAMFGYCTSLTSAPVLPATTLVDSCYSGMFTHCTSLTSAPVLPASTLVSKCYYNMFIHCSSLSYVKCLATSGFNTISNLTTSGWLGYVNSTGTFVKASGVTWSSGMSGIPTGWNVVEV